jgi:putative membrane protein
MRFANAAFLLMTVIAARTHADQPAQSSSTAMGGVAAAHADPELQQLTTEKFFVRSTAVGMKEVHAAELALRNTQNDHVKSFARKMVSDHTEQNSQITTLAARHGVPVPRDLPPKQSTELEKLRVEKGSTFDTTFIEQMRMDHERAIALFQSCASSSVIAAEVRTFCSKSLPVLEEHARAAKDLEERTTTRPAADE